MRPRPISIHSEDLNIQRRSKNMSRVEVWETLPSFEMWSEKSFFGLDKSAAHCFTLPKQMTDPMIRYFGLREGKLQVPITFSIAGRRYPAIVRWVRLDRRNPYKLEKEDLPKKILFNLDGAVTRSQYQQSELLYKMLFRK